MNNISNDKLEEIKNKSDIVEVISSYIPLTKKGRNYFGLCPFHDDHSPSMSVSREKKIYNCFVCGAKGNVVNFVMNFENVNYIEALKILGDKCGIPLNINTYEKREDYSNFYKIYELSNKFYQNNLKTELGEEAVKYLEKRSINEDIIKEFKIGLALGYDKSLTKLLIKKGYKEQDLVDIGLSNKTDYGYQDLFLNRIMFPLWNIDGKIVGYSGRIYNTDKKVQAKYINTKETKIFTKGLNLYNYHRAKNEVRMSGQVIIMEGFMDCIRAYSVGIKNVVATMGTALTVEQATLIKKLSHNVILCFDGDSAGGKASYACGNELYKLGINPKVVRLESNLDPDEYILKYGEKKFKEKLDNAINFIDFKISYLKEGKNINDSVELSEYINSVVNEVKLIDDDVLRELTLKKVANEINISFETLMNKLWKSINDDEKKAIEEVQEDNFNVDTNKKVYTPKKRKVINNEVDNKVISKYTKAENMILYYMLHNKDITYKYEKVFPYLPTKKNRFLAQEVMYFVKKYDTINISDFCKYLSDKPELMDLVGQILNHDYKKEYTDEEIKDYFKVIKEYNLNQEINRLQKEMKSVSDKETKLALANKIMNLKMGVCEDARN